MPPRCDRRGAGAKRMCRTWSGPASTGAVAGARSRGHGGAGLVGQRRLHRAIGRQRIEGGGLDWAPRPAPPAPRADVDGRRRVGRRWRRRGTGPAVARAAAGSCAPMVTVMVPCGWPPRSGETRGMTMRLGRSRAGAPRRARSRRWRQPGRPEGHRCRGLRSAVAVAVAPAAAPSAVAGRDLLCECARGPSRWPLPRSIPSRPG